jgi:hypothetical protein
MPYDPSTLIPAYKEKVEELLAKDEQFRNIVEKQVSNFRSMGTSFTNGITLKEGIAGVVAGKPRLYDLNESPYFKKNREKYKVLNIMHKAVTKLPLNILIKSSKKSAKNKSARENKPTSPEFSYIEEERKKGDKKRKTILAKMPKGLKLDEARKYMIQAYKEAYGPSKKSAKSAKSAKKSVKKSAKKPTTLNMDFLPGPSGLPGAMQRIPSSTIRPNPYGKLRKKRKATKKNKPSKRSKASKKSKSSKKTRRRTRRRRY